MLFDAVIFDTVNLDAFLLEVSFFMLYLTPCLMVFLSCVVDSVVAVVVFADVFVVDVFVVDIVVVNLVVDAVVDVVVDVVANIVIDVVVDVVVDAVVDVVVEVFGQYYTLLEQKAIISIFISIIDINVNLSKNEIDKKINLS